MYRTLKNLVSYERFVIGLTGLCVLSLYAFALTQQPAHAYPLVPSMKVDATAKIAAPRAPQKPTRIMLVGSTDKLSDVFERIGYQLDGVRRHGEVPRLFLATLPRDLSKIRVAADRKSLFIKSALPLILHVNELILAERARIIALKTRLDQGEKLHADETAWLDQTRERYELEKLDFAEMLQRIDIIPPSLALAQGAEESGWGTSRFAREGNALFGQRIFKGTRGIVPMKRDRGQKHRVRAFGHLIDGVKAYADNLNTHSAYKLLREVRAKMRASGRVIDGKVLASTLVKYSERREKYVDTIKVIIRANHFHLYDKARLGDRLTVIASDSGI
jgi:Bax protein